MGGPATAATAAPMTPPTKNPDAPMPKAQPFSPAVGPLRPRRRLTVVLLAVYVVWMAAMVVMYLTTVRGRGG